MVRAILCGMAGVLTATGWAGPAGAEALERIAVSGDGGDLIKQPSGERFFVWGVNYDHDRDGRLLEDYWHDEWAAIEDDFAEMKALGVNVVRVHLQFGQFMPEPGELDAANLDRLEAMVALAEETGLYLNITGLACYHKDETPAWYDALEESERWAAQADWWEAIAEACGGSPAIFCFDLMNEPILTGGDDAGEWLPGDGFGGKHFVQRITLDLGERSRKAVARAWVDTLAEAIRRHDDEALVTVGAIPWVFHFGGGSPLFYSDEVGEALDVASVHFYPESGEVDEAVEALKVYDVGKPLVIEEIFPLKCSIEELETFVERFLPVLDGVTGFYWGQTIAELESADRDIGQSITLKWLQYFRDAKPDVMEAIREGE